MNLKDFWNAIRKLFGWKEHKPKPEPTPSPIPVQLKGIPSIVNRELLIDGAKTAAIGIYWMLVDKKTYPTEKEIRAEFMKCANAGANLVRIWVSMNWDTEHLAPWVERNGVYYLNEIDESFLARMRMMSRVAHEVGVCIAWVCFDGYSLRLRPRWWACNPGNHIDTNTTRLFAQENYDSGNQFCLSRAFWACNSKMDGSGPDPKRHGESFDAPVQWELVRNVAAIAYEHHDLVYLWSEMFTDQEHSSWDIDSMIEYNRVATNHIREMYTDCIIGTSTGRNQCRAYGNVQIADVHGISDVTNAYPLQVSEIGNAVRYLREQVNSNLVICANTDGAMSLPRFTPSFVKDMCLKAWAAGAFPEFKGGSIDEINGVLEGIRQARSI